MNDPISPKALDFKRFRARSPFRPISPSSSRAFTLIELLTVLAIIGIIAAIVVPVTSGVREKARLTDCASKMRQLSQGIHLYQADNRGYLPPNFASSGGKAKEIWTVVIRPYLEVEDASTYGTGTERTNQFLSCPSLSENLQPDAWWESNYALGTAFGRDGVPRKVVSVSDPAKRVMIVENRNPSARSLNSSGGPWSSIGYNHGGRANVVFHDGHMEQWTENDTPKDGDDPAWSP